MKFEYPERLPKGELTAWDGTVYRLPEDGLFVPFTLIEELMMNPDKLAFWSFNDADGCPGRLWLTWRLEDETV